MVRLAVPAPTELASGLEREHLQVAREMLKFGQ
jgi:hypothetical protein